MPTLFDRYCALRRFLRRKSWWYLAPALILAYPVGWLLLIAFSVTGKTGDNLTQAIAAEAGQTVDPLLFLCKLGIGVALFATINGLGFAALSVVPVAPDWAVGRYKEPQHYQAVGLEQPVRGFKYTFLTLAPLARIVLYVVLWALELAVAYGSMDVAFKIQ